MTAIDFVINVRRFVLSALTVLAAGTSYAQTEDVSAGALPDKLAWLPLEASAGQTDPSEELTVPEITITKTPKPTADASNYTREYVLELEKFNISNDGTHPAETSKGINAALQHASVLKANRIVFPKGTYLISETDPIVIDLKDTIIDLNGATLQINVNAEPKYKMVNFVDGTASEPKDSSANKLPEASFWHWLNLVVPVAMEIVAFDSHALHLNVRHFAACLVVSCVEPTVNLQAFGRAG